MQFSGSWLVSPFERVTVETLESERVKGFPGQAVCRAGHTAWWHRKGARQLGRDLPTVVSSGGSWASPRLTVHPAFLTAVRAALKCPARVLCGARHLSLQRASGCVSTPCPLTGGPWGQTGPSHGCGFNLTTCPGQQGACSTRAEPGRPVHSPALPRPLCSSEGWKHVAWVPMHR